MAPRSGGAFENNWSLGQQLGQGAFATVYKCRNSATGEQCAVKIMNKSKATNEVIQYQRIEIDILSSLNHPHIVQLKDHYEDTNQIYVVMELMEGGELFDKIVELEHFSERSVVRLMGNIVSTVAFLHEHNVAHRDIKPENLLLRRKHVIGDNLDDLLSEIKLVDFGVAEKYTPGKPMTLLCGSVEFMAPEVLQFKLTGVGYSEKCDIWSLGVLAYVLLCGWMPFADDDQDVLERRIMTGTFDFHNGTIWDEISAEAKDFVSQLLTVNPNKRLSASQALTHRWLWTDTNSQTHLTGSTQRLRRMSRMRKASLWANQETGESSSAAFGYNISPMIRSTTKANNVVVSPSQTLLNFKFGNSLSPSNNNSDSMSPTNEEEEKSNNKTKSSFDEFYTLGAQISGGTENSPETYRCSLRNGPSIPQRVVKIVYRNNSILTQRLKKEASLLMSLHHPNIIKVWDFFETGLGVYMVTEMLSGGDLMDKIGEFKHYTESAAMRIIRTILGVVDYLHTNCICHRDICLETLILKQDSDSSSELDSFVSEVVLVDFGKACKFTPGKATISEPHPRSIELASPEMIKWKRNWVESYDEQCDMWSIGLVSYVLLCGRPPFMGSVRSIEENILAAQVKFPSGTVWDSISDHAKQFVSSLLLPDPNQRLNIQQAMRHPWVWASDLHCNTLSGSARGIRRMSTRRSLRNMPLQTVQDMDRSFPWHSDLSNNVPRANSSFGTQVTPIQYRFGVTNPLPAFSSPLNSSGSSNGSFSTRTSKFIEDEPEESTSLPPLPRHLISPRRDSLYF